MCVGFWQNLCCVRACVCVYFAKYDQQQRNYTHALNVKALRVDSTILDRDPALSATDS